MTDGETVSMLLYEASLCEEKSLSGVISNCLPRQSSVGIGNKENLLETAPKLKNACRKGRHVANIRGILNIGDEGDRQFTATVMTLRKCYLLKGPFVRFECSKTIVINLRRTEKTKNAIFNTLKQKCYR